MIRSFADKPTARLANRLFTSKHTGIDGLVKRALLKQRPALKKSG